MRGCPLAIQRAIQHVLEGVNAYEHQGACAGKGGIGDQFSRPSDPQVRRLRIAVGNAIALYYEANPAFAKVATDPTSLIFVCVLAAVIIPLVRQEYNITQLMAPPATESSQKHRIKELAAEFSLSARETEIVMLIARGFTTDNVAKKLVISPYTVNTHIRHVYEKVGIHKRSELIDYINRTGSDDDKKA